MGDGALLHDAREKMSLRSGGIDAHIISSMDTYGALDVAGIYEH